jgi:hypothetical protein
MNATTMPQLMIARVSGSMFQTRRPEIVAMTQPTTLKNVTISNAPTKSGSEECLTSLAYPQYEFCFGSLSAASVLIKVNGSCPLGPSKKGGCRQSAAAAISSHNADLIESIMLVTDQHTSEPSVHKDT